MAQSLHAWVRILQATFCWFCEIDRFIFFFSDHFFLWGRIEDLVIQMTVKCNLVHRDGQDHATISDMSVRTEISYFKVHHEYQNVVSAITSKVSDVVNSRWKIMKPLFDPTLNEFVIDVLPSIVTPMLEKISLQDFFQYNRQTCSNSTNVGYSLKNWVKPDIFSNVNDIYKHKHANDHTTRLLRPLILIWKNYQTHTFKVISNQQCELQQHNELG